MTRGARLCPRPECGEVHGTFARCKDGVKVYTYKTTGASRAPKKSRASKRNAEAAIRSAPGVPASADLREEMAAAVVADETKTKPAAPAGFAEVNGILVPTDPAKIAEIIEDNRRYALAAEHEAAERALGMHLPVPKELRRPDSKASNALLAQIGHVKDLQAEYKVKDVSVDQALATTGHLRDVVSARLSREAAAAAAPKPEMQRAPGEYPWRCMDMKCRTAFRSLSIEAVRRKAKAEPGWRLVCPACGGQQVIQEEAAA